MGELSVFIIIIVVFSCLNLSFIFLCYIFFSLYFYGIMASKFLPSSHRTGHIYFERLRGVLGIDLQSSGSAGRNVRASPVLHFMIRRDH